MTTILPADACIAGLRVLVAGALNMDYILCADHEPADDGTAWLSSATDAVGGHAGNCAAALARLGAETALLGAVGQDADGTAIIDSLLAAGVNVEHVRRVPMHTGRAFIPVFPDRRFMLIDRAANEGLNADDLINAQPFDYDAVVVFDPPGDILDRLFALRSGRRPSALLCWNPGGQYARATRRRFALEVFDLLVVNRNEYRQMFGLEPPDQRGLQTGQEIVQTLGARGARLYSGEGVLEIPAPKVEAKDSTGAGDAFCAALTLARAAGVAPANRLRFANAVGASATLSYGARASLPTLSEAIALCREYGDTAEEEAR